MWLTPETAAEWAKVSVRLITDYRKGAGVPAGCKPLKASVLPGGRLVRIKAEWVDDFLEQFAVQGGSLDDIADEVMGKLKKGRRK